MLKLLIQMFKHRLPIEHEVMAASKKLRSIAPDLTKGFQMLRRRILIV